MKLHIILHIDTTDNQKTEVALIINNSKKSYFEETKQNASQVVLPLVEKALKEQNMTLQDISEITVNIGPGSFTGTRVGVAIANTLAWSLGVTVNGVQQVEPVYEASKFDEA